MAKHANLSVCRSSDQTKDEFENFIKNLIRNIANKSPFLIVALGDSNAKMQGWYQNDITTFDGFKIDSTTSQFGLSQIIKEPIYFEQFRFLHRLNFYVAT